MNNSTVTKTVGLIRDFRSVVTVCFDSEAGVCKMEITPTVVHFRVDRQHLG